MVHPRSTRDGVVMVSPWLVPLCWTEWTCTDQVWTGLFCWDFFVFSNNLKHSSFSWEFVDLKQLQRFCAAKHKPRKSLISENIGQMNVSLVLQRAGFCHQRHSTIYFSLARRDKKAEAVIEWSFLLVRQTAGWTEGLKLISMLHLMCAPHVTPAEWLDDCEITHPKESL